MASTLTFAIPVAWDISTAYEINTIVFIGKKAYTAVQDVPTGIQITNTDYWVETGVKETDISQLQAALDALQNEVDDNTADISAAQADIIANANNLTQLTTRLDNAVTSIENDAMRINNIMITLYTPQDQS